MRRAVAFILVAVVALAVATPAFAFMTIDEAKDRIKTEIRHETGLGSDRPITVQDCFHVRDNVVECDYYHYMGWAVPPDPTVASCYGWGKTGWDFIWISTPRSQGTGSYGNGSAGSCYLTS